MASQKSKFIQWIDHRIRVTISDNRMIVGTFLAFDKHFNLVISETEEFRRIKPKKKGDPEKEIKRVLGLIILRGENIISITAEAPPVNSNRKQEQMPAGPGKTIPITRMGAVPLQTIGQAPNINQPLKGLGQPSMMNMMPSNKNMPPPMAPNINVPNVKAPQQ